eukprot:1190607-Prorocentrum_minimum.AAC.5
MSTVQPGEPKVTETFQKCQTYNSVFVSGREVKEGNCVLIRCVLSWLRSVSCKKRNHEKTGFLGKQPFQRPIMKIGV